MAKTKPKQRKSFPGGPGNAGKTMNSKPSLNTDLGPQRPFRWGLVVLFLAIALGGSYLAILMRPASDVPRFGFKVLNEYPHDPAAFTQGLLVDDGVLWESTGRTGQSSVRKVDLKTGEILKQVDLDEKYFGEGLAIHDDRIYQLTWKSNKAFVYDRELNKIDEIEYEGQGWGLTSDGTDLIFSNGTLTLSFLDPKTFAVRRKIQVHGNGLRLRELNELEYAGGKIFANGYQTDDIYEIDPQTGEVTTVIDLAGLWPRRERPADGVLNGIAFNPATKKLLVTGKLCPKIFEVELVEKAK